MNPAAGSQDQNFGQAPNNSAKRSRPWQLGMTPAMSPSMMASNGPSLDSMPAFAPNMWPSMHHSASTPQMYPDNASENLGPHSDQYLSGPSTFSAPSNPPILSTAVQGQQWGNQPTNRTPNDELRRQTNIAHMIESSNGSPSRFLRTSPNPGNGSNSWSNRAPRPAQLGFGNNGDNLQANFHGVQGGPKSAPAQVNSFEQSAVGGTSRTSDNGLSDERWPSDTPARASHITSAYPSSTHLELLQAQYGITNLPGLGGNERAFVAEQLRPQVPNGGSSPLPAGQRAQASSTISTGRGYDNLRAYIEIAASGGERSLIPELERVMSTLLYLRGDNDGLPVMNHFGRDALRQFMYNCVFDAEDGSSQLSRENPYGMIDVVGQRVSRHSLHEEITHFLEDQLESMMASPNQSAQNGIKQLQRSPTVEDFNHAIDSNCARNFQADRQDDYSNQSGLEIFPTSRATIERGGDDGQSPIGGFENLNMGSPHRGNNTFHNSDPRRAWDPSMLSGVPNLLEQQQPQSNFFPIPGMGPGLQGAPSQYGQPAMGFMQQQQPYQPMLQQHLNQQQLSQQYGPFLSPHFMNTPVSAGPMYFPSSGPPLTFYPGRQVIPQGGPMMPYGPQLPPNAGFGMQHFMGGMVQPPYLSNPQLALSALPPHMSGWASQPFRGMPVSASPQWAQPSERNRNPKSRSGSPMLGGTQSRAGRNVVSHVPLLPYRPGSDDMYPSYNPKAGSTVRKQELERSGPSYEFASKPENLPFFEAARQAQPAQWGVLKIGNIPYSLTKQEVLGLLGRNAKIVTPDLGVPIHIIMDRTTGKTMDCYVEFFSTGDAQAALNKCLLRGSQLRLGDRVIDVALSSQDALLAELFPKAKNVEWRNGRPLIRQSTDAFNSGFKTFVTHEELLQLYSHAEKPHRSNYTQKCLQRPYECMISTLSKFPWFAVDLYTVNSRDEIFDKTLSLIKLLMNQLRRGPDIWIPHLHESLLIDLLYAGLNVPAFGEYQRMRLREAAGDVGDRIPMSPLIVYWPFEILCRKPGFEEDYVAVFASFFKKHPLNESDDPENPFGSWTLKKPETMGLITMGQIGAHEMQMMLSMLRDVLD